MKKYTLLGIDGGATKVSVWQVLPQKNNAFTLGHLNSQKEYNKIPGFLASFEPVNIQQQLAECEYENIPVNNNEQQMETVYVEACALAIEDIAEQLSHKELLIGIGMPGLKTTDKRGIGVVANGPRMVNYCDLLEKRLQSAGIRVIEPVAQLGSDADYCGMGENYAEQGAFKGCKNGYYLGGGTGVADAIKLNERLYPFDVLKVWMAKSWELKSEDGNSLEMYCSAVGIQKLYAEACGVDIQQLNANKIYPPQIAERAVQGEKEALFTFEKVINNLALLIFSRITTLFYGWRGEFEFVNPAKEPLTKSHGRTGTLLEKIIIGQRLGDLVSSEAGKSILFNPLKQKLLKLVQEDKKLTKNAKEHYRKMGSVLTTSSLREAPALGAAIDAFLNRTEK